MKKFNISVQTEGYEYFTVEAESYEEAVKKIKKGEVEMDNSESDWCSEFYVDSEEDI